MNPTTQSSPRISVVLPVFNTRPYLDEAVASIRAQAWPDLEILAVDDGSTDGTAEYLAALCPEAKLRCQPNRGPAATRNAALAQATGRYVTFLDGDDIWPAGKLAQQSARLDADPELQATMGFMRMFRDEPDPASGRTVRRWGRPSFLFLLGGMLCRRELFAPPPTGVGTFDGERYPYYGEDTDWFFRAWEAGRKMEILETVSLHYRRRPGSLTEDAEQTKRSFPGLMQQSLRRRRGPDGRTRPLPPTLQLPVNGPG